MGVAAALVVKIWAYGYHFTGRKQVHKLPNGGLLYVLWHLE